jgi:hypothetical protein
MRLTIDQEMALNSTRLEPTLSAAEAANGAAPPRIILGLAKRPPDTRWTVIQVMPGSLRLSFVDRLDAGVQLLCHVQEGQEIFCIGFDGPRLLMMQGDRRYLLEGPSVHDVIQHSRVASGLDYPELRVKLTALPPQRVSAAGTLVSVSRVKLQPARAAWPAGLPGSHVDHVDHVGAGVDLVRPRAVPPVTVVIKRRRALATALPGRVAVACPEPEPS